MRRRRQNLFQSQVHDRHPRHRASFAVVLSHDRTHEGDLARRVHGTDVTRHVVRRRYRKFIPRAVVVVVGTDAIAVARAVHAKARERVLILAPSVVQEEIAPEDGAAGDVQIGMPLQVAEYRVGILVEGRRRVAEEGERVTPRRRRRHRGRVDPPRSAIGPIVLGGRALLRDFRSRGRLLRVLRGRLPVRAASFRRRRRRRQRSGSKPLPNLRNQSIRHGSHVLPRPRRFRGYHASSQLRCPPRRYHGIQHGGHGGGPRLW
mmetsp:Transcript_8785/g.18572  ORF Transcript_8785/g.18572 Transcript_8785/m.18572 type:complete len:261 (-) Transcript_8785:321-1103(-)